MKRLPVFVFAICASLCSAQASNISLKEPTIRGMRIVNSKFLPVGEQTPRTSDVFVIEFSSSANLRNWSQELQALILPEFYLCNQPQQPDAEEHGYDGYFIADQSGIIGIGGLTGSIPEMPLPSSGRYATFVFVDQGKAEGLPSLGNVTEDLCMKVGVFNADDLPDQWTGTLVIKSDRIHAAWKEFLKK